MGKRQIWNTYCIFGVVMALTHVLAGTAFAEYNHGYFKYDVADGSVTITGYVGSDEAVTVLNTIAGNPVNVIGEGVFASNFDIRKV